MPDRLDVDGRTGGTRRQVEVRPGEFAPETIDPTLRDAHDDAANAIRTLASYPSFDLLLNNATNLAASSSVQSAFFDLEALGVKELLIARKSTGGTYALEIDWSVDGATALITETIPTTTNTSATKTAVTRFVRVRARNTDAVTAFSDHRTLVHGR